MLEDTRSIIAEQLGKELGDVSSKMAAAVSQSGLARPESQWSCFLQVRPESKFVDLGADSLDTVSHTNNILSTF